MGPDCPRKGAQRCWLSYSPVALLRYHNQGNLQKRVLGTQGFRGLESVTGRKQGSRLAGRLGTATGAESPDLEIKILR